MRKYLKIARIALFVGNSGTNRATITTCEVLDMDSVTVTKQNRITAGAEMIRAHNAGGLKLKDWLKDKLYY